jgi:hypothetical protein
VEQGADKNKAKGGVITPLKAALSEGHTEVAAYLQAVGAR